MSIYVKELPQENLEFQMFVLDELADELLIQGQDLIKITIGISELPVPDNILKVFADTIYDKHITRLVYPEGLPLLREAIANYYEEQFNVSVQARQVIINVGTSAIYRNLLQLLCKPGQEILLPKPYYCLYLLSAILAGAKTTFYEIDPYTNSIDIDSFEKSYNPEKTAIIVINNPGNPLGNIISCEEIKIINNIVDGRSFIINDEIYNNTLFYQRYVSPLSYLDDKYREFNIITNAFSKGFRMYTKRVGYAILPESLITPMRILQQHTLLTCDPVNQYGMIEALKSLDSPNELTRIYRERAEYAYKSLMNTDCYPIKSRAGFYITLDCEKWIQKKNMTSSKELARDILEKVLVATVPGTDFGMPFGLRLSFCNERFNEAIDRLRGYFAKSER